MRASLIVLVIAASAAFGQTSDAPKRTLFTTDNQTPSKLVKPTVSTDAPAKPTPVSDNNRGASSRALDAMNSSTEDLNIIRDSNVRGLNSGCSPESSTRLADLAGRLQTLGVKVELPKSAAASGNPRPGSDTAALTLASDWYKQAGDSSSTSSQSGKDRKEALLDSVLPGTNTSAADVAVLKGEFDRLVASCTTAKR